MKCLENVLQMLLKLNIELIDDFIFFLNKFVVCIFNNFRLILEEKKFYKVCQKKSKGETLIKNKIKKFFFF